MGLIPRRIDREDLEEWQPRLWLVLVGLLLLAAYVIAFIVKNRDRVTIDFVLFDATISLIWLILLGVGLGFLGGVLLSQLYRRRRRTRSGGAAQEPLREGADQLGEPDHTRVDVPGDHGAEREPG
jgi:uncharacterized integral membrane protein